MKNKQILLGIFFSIVFFVVAFITARYFFDWILSSSKDVIFISSTLPEMFRQTFFYAVVVALIPITLILLWKVTPVVSIKARVISCLVIVASIFIAGLLRYQWVKVLASRFRETVKEKYASKEDDIQAIFPISRVHMEIYILAGLFIGVIVVYFIFSE